ncbi:MAG: hypothetical protein ACTSXA_09745 [Candidatus Heimdallarchaeota archaeon]
MMQILAEWFIVNDDRLTFTVEVTLFVGFIFISILLLLLRGRFPQLTKNGWIELLIGAFCIALKGLFDGLDTLVHDDLLHDIFDGTEAAFMFIGLILLGIGLLRITIFSAKIWEVR